MFNRLGRLAMDMGRANQRLVNKGLTSSMASGSAKASGLFGRMAMSPVGGMALFGGVGAAMSYDSTKNNFSSHMSQEGLKIGADIIGDAAIFGIGSKMGIPGMIGATALSIGMHLTGVNPGAFVGKYLDNVSNSYKKEMGLGATPIKKNRRTMQVMQQNMGLLRQSSGFGNLGNEAALMHN